MNRRFLLLPLAAVVIAMLTTYKLTRTYAPAPVNTERVSKQLAPPIELLDQKKPSELVRLGAHQGRESILIVFFDGTNGAGADRSPTLAKIRDEYPKLHHAGIVVLAVSAAIPQENRKAIEAVGPFPFPLLSDPDLSVHRNWGRIDAATGKPLMGVFLVDRAGNVPWSSLADVPRPEADAESNLDGFLKSVLDAN